MISHIVTLLCSIGNLEVGVHIADVTHFIRPGTPIDKEAAYRSTSGIIFIHIFSVKSNMYLFHSG